MRQITINIPENKYSFFLELVKNLGLEKVKESPTGSTGEGKGRKTVGNSVASLRGRLHLTKEQYKNFHLYINDSRNEWNRGI